MTDPYATSPPPPWGGAPVPPPWGTPGADVATPSLEPRRPREFADGQTIGDIRVALVAIVALAVAGALLGLVWSVWSGPQQRAFVIAPGKLYPFDEVETMAAADGRYLVLVAAAGLVAGLVTWFARPQNRGPAVLFGLGLGGLAGAALTEWIGYLTGGGTVSGRANTTIAHLPLSLHMHGLLFVEAAVAVLVYGVFVAFAARDDLGRPDPSRRQRSVHAGDELDDAGGYRDAPGPLQQRDLPPQ